MNTTTNKELRRTGENERKIDELTKRWWNNGGRGRFASDSWPVGRRASAPNDRTQRWKNKYIKKKRNQNKVNSKN